MDVMGETSLPTTAFEGGGGATSQETQVPRDDGEGRKQIPVSLQERPALPVSCFKLNEIHFRLVASRTVR